MVEGICMCFYKAIVQSMFKHVASENAPLVLLSCKVILKFPLYQSTLIEI